MSQKKRIYVTQVGEKIRVGIEDSPGNMRIINLSPSTALGVIEMLQHAINGVLDEQAADLRKQMPLRAAG